MNGFATPILFLIFNRPVQTKRVFEAIRARRPRRLFIAADGPRQYKPMEGELCRKTREVVAAVDWPCEVKTLFHDENRGCAAAVNQGISWFFDQVEEGIILEDDCLPHPDFFPYCETLLAKYRDVPTIGTIAGTHFFPAELSHARSHYVSKHFQMWGWATWRRTWVEYDHYLSDLSEDEWMTVLRKTHPIALEVGFWREILKALRAGGIDTWDFQMAFSCWRIGANHVMPGRNLISNIGYGPEATHTNFSSPMAGLPLQPLPFDLNETVPLTPDPILDNVIFYLRYLDSLTHTWWLDPIFAPDQNLSDARIELLKRERQMQKMEGERQIQSGRLLAATAALAKAHAALNARQSLIGRILGPK